MVKMDDLTENIVGTLLSLERGDTFEARIITPGGCEAVHQYEVADTREVGDRNGFLRANRVNANIPNNTRRLYVTDDGVSVAHGWSSSETMIENIALECGTLDSPDYHIEVTRDADGEITESRLVRDDEVSAGSATPNL